MCAKCESDGTAENLAKRMRITRQFVALSLSLFLLVSSLSLISTQVLIIRVFKDNEADGFFSSFEEFNTSIKNENIVNVNIST